jgi:hypothetical protein
MGVPSSYSVDVDVTDLPDIAVSSIGPVGPVTLAGIPSTYTLDVDRLPQIRIHTDPIELKITEIPSVRGHIPSDYKWAFSVLGFEIVSARLCGETQVITEPYVANPCECHSLTKAPGASATIVPSAVLKLAGA